MNKRIFLLLLVLALVFSSCATHRRYKNMKWKKKKGDCGCKVYDRCITDTLTSTLWINNAGKS